MLFNKHGLRPIIAVPLFYAMFRGVDLTIKQLGGTSFAFASTQSILVRGALIRESCQVVAMVLLIAVLSHLQAEPALNWGYRDARWLSRLGGGLICGFMFISTVILSLWLGGFGAVEYSQPDAALIVKFAALWGLMFILVGFLEESMLRGYLQYILSRNYGFWTAALILAALFALMHAFHAGESPVGLITVIGFALVACLSLWYTGSLWWAIGFHIG